MNEDPTSGWKSTEFYTTLLTLLLPVFTAIFHQDLSAQIPVVATAAAGVATAAYSVSRALTKSSHARARATVLAATAGPVASAPPALGVHEDPATDASSSNGSISTRPAGVVVIGL